ncbi:MAG: hypothetical protein Q9184_004899 [Pyrenodesmia sp. 2 TL-2023]
MFSYSVVVIVSNIFQLLTLVVAAPALPNNHGGIIQLPSSSNTNVSAPQQVFRPPDPSIYRLRPDGTLYIILRDLGEQMVYREAVFCLHMAWVDINSKIAQSAERHGGDVMQTLEWVYGSVRLKIIPNLPAVMDYGLLRDYITGIQTFATREGGYWEWRVTFLARVRDLEFRELATAEMIIVR